MQYSMVDKRLPCSSSGKESARIGNVQNPGSVPGSCPGEGRGYALQNSWASLVVQMVKNPPAMQEIWVRSLDWEDPLEKGMASHTSILAWRISMDRRAWWATVRGVTNSLDTTEWLSRVQHIVDKSTNWSQLNHLLAVWLGATCLTFCASISSSVTWK